MTSPQDRLRRATLAAYSGAAVRDEVPPQREFPVPQTRRSRRLVAPRQVFGVRVIIAVRVAALALAVGVLAAVVLTVRQPTAVEVPLPVPTAPAENSDVGSAEVSSSPTRQSFVVHVAGAVRKPGIVTLPEGSRVTDAIDAAGGAERAADLNAVNLAGTVADGQQIYVPTEGEEAPPAVSSAAEASTAPGADVAVVDVNTADATTLETLPGIGPALAAEIIAWREKSGGFASVDQLQDVPGIGPATVEKLRDRVRV